MTTISDKTKVSIGLLLALITGALALGGAVVRGEATAARVSKIEDRRDGEESFKQELSRQLGDLNAKVDFLIQKTK